MPILEAVGLAERADHRPAQLSGGERQRVAIARSLVTKPACILMDEPTGNLDHVNAKRVMDLIRQMSQSTDTAIILVTHDASIASLTDRELRLVDGSLQSMS